MTKTFSTSRRIIGSLEITNAMLAGSIAYSKLSLTGAILNADLAGSIAYSKLALTGTILNADLAGSIAYSKLSLTGAILNADLAGSIADDKISSAATWNAMMPKAGGTFVGNVLATDNLYDIGASGATRFRTAYLGTSLFVPAINGGTAANDDVTIEGTSHATKTTSYVKLQPSGGFVGIGIASPLTYLELPGTTTNNSSLKVGSLEFQPYAVNNAFFGENIYYNGGFKYRANGYAAYFSFGPGDFSINTAPSGVAGNALTPTQRFKVYNTIGVSIGPQTATAALHIQAPTGTASTGQIKLAVGTPPTTPEDGLMNYTSVKGLTFDVSTSLRGVVGLWAYKAITATYPITAQDYTLEATSGTFTATLPDATTISGRVYIITNSGAGVLTVATTSSQTFSNVVATPTTLTLAQFNTVTLQSNGTSWLRLTNL